MSEEPVATPVETPKHTPRFWINVLFAAVTAAAASAWFGLYVKPVLAVSLFGALTVALTVVKFFAGKDINNALTRSIDSPVMSWAIATALPLVIASLIVTPLIWKPDHIVRLVPGKTLIAYLEPGKASLIELRIDRRGTPLIKPHLLSLETLYLGASLGSVDEINGDDAHKRLLREYAAQQGVADNRIEGLVDRWLNHPTSLATPRLIQGDSIHLVLNEPGQIKPFELTRTIDPNHVNTLFIERPVMVP